MYNDLKENWSYNEWPDVDLEGNIIMKKRVKLTEAVSHRVCKDCGADLANDGTCPRCNDPETYFNEDTDGKTDVCPDCGKNPCECEDKLDELFNIDVPINLDANVNARDVSVLSGGMAGLGECKLKEGEMVKQYVHYAKDGTVDASADSAQELADMLGIEKMTVLNKITRKDPRFAKVEYDDDDDFSDLKMDECKALKEGILDTDDLENLAGKKIQLTKDTFYCDIDDWYDPDNIPEYMELRGKELFIPAGTVLTCNGKGPSGWPTLGDDELDFAAGEIFAKILNESVSLKEGTEDQMKQDLLKILKDNAGKSDEEVADAVHTYLSSVKEDTSIKKCDKCGKILPANDPTADCKNMKLQEAAEDEDVVEDDIVGDEDTEDPVDPVEDEEVADLKGQVRDALDSLVPAEGEDELDPHDVIDAVLAYFDNEDALDYIRSCVCVDEEDLEDEAEEAEDAEDVVDDVMDEGIFSKKKPEEEVKKNAPTKTVMSTVFAAAKKYARDKNPKKIYATYDNSYSFTIAAAEGNLPGQGLTAMFDAARKYGFKSSHSQVFSSSDPKTRYRVDVYTFKNV